MDMKNDIKNRCGNCKDFSLFNKGEIFGNCLSFNSKIKNKSSRSIFSKACNWQRRIKDAQ